jgi:hypothetical protein
MRVVGNKNTDPLGQNDIFVTPEGDDAYLQP